MDQFKRKQVFLAIDFIAVQASPETSGEFSVQVVLVDPRHFALAEAQRALLQTAQKTPVQYCLPGMVVTQEMGVNATVHELMRGLWNDVHARDLPAPKLVSVFDRTPQDLFGSKRFPSLVYLLVLNPSPTTFAEGVVKVSLQDVFGMELLFDHSKILAESKEAVEKEFENNIDLIRALMGNATFTLGALHRVYQLLVGRKSDRSNFARTATGRFKAEEAIDDEGEPMSRKVVHRSSVKLYRFCESSSRATGEASCT